MSMDLSGLLGIPPDVLATHPMFHPAIRLAAIQHAMGTGGPEIAPRPTMPAAAPDLPPVGGPAMVPGLTMGGTPHDWQHTLAYGLAQGLQSLPPINPGAPQGDQFAQALIRGMAGGFARPVLAEDAQRQQFNQSQQAQAAAINKINAQASADAQKEGLKFAREKFLKGLTTKTGGDGPGLDTPLTSDQATAIGRPELVGVTPRVAGLGSKKAKGGSAPMGGNVSGAVGAPAGDDASIIEGIYNGTIPPTSVAGRMTQYNKPIYAGLQRRGYDLSKRALDFTAEQKFFGQMNSAQQVRIRQNASMALEALDNVDNIAQALQAKLPASKGNVPILNRAVMNSAKGGLFGPEAASLATQLDAQVGDVSAELGNLYMGGNSPTDHALSLAQKNIQGQWSLPVLKDATKLARQNINFRLTAINTSAPITTSGQQQAPAAPPRAGYKRIVHGDGTAADWPANRPVPAGWKEQ